MNEIFTWTRATGELAPTGRLVNPQVGTSSKLTDALVNSFGAGFFDMDGVANGLNYSTAALDMAGDLKRDPSIYNALTDTGLSANPPAAATNVSTTHYGANDLVMAYLMFKCFGASAYDPTAIIYNVDDAFNMLSSKQLAAAITASLEAEDALANACVQPNGKAVSAQLPGDNKGQVDAMFRAFLAADPLRYFLNGVQIPGLFETNFVAADASGADPSVGGNWCLTIGDRVEIPLQLVFRAEVNVLSVQDNVQNPSSNTPDSANTNFIKGEAANFDSAVGKADKANAIPIRLQLVCGPPSSASTKSTSLPAGQSLPLQVAASASAVLYTPANYGVQTAIVAIGAGGVAPYTYSFGVCDAGFPTTAQGLTINAATGLIQFKAALATRSAEWKAADLAATAAAAALVGVSQTDTDYAVKSSLKTKADAALVQAEAVARAAGANDMNIAAVVSKKYAAQIIISDSTLVGGVPTPVKVPVTVNITFDDGAGSSINANLAPAGSGSGGSGSSAATFTITDSIVIQGQAVTVGTSYTFVNNSTNDGVKVIFIDNIDPQVGNAINGFVSVLAGDSITLTAPAGAVAVNFKY
jgi:hypothetical protein